MNERPVAGAVRRGASGTTGGATAADAARAIGLTKVHEGERRLPNGRHQLYKCPAGYWTIGWGRNLDAKGLSDAEAELLLQNDLREACAELDGLAPWWRRLEVPRRVVMVDLMFVLGPTKLAKFAPTLALIEAGDYAGAAARLRRTKWFSDVKGRGVRMVEMMRTGQWPAEVA